MPRGLEPQLPLPYPSAFIPQVPALGAAAAPAEVQVSIAQRAHGTSLFDVSLPCKLTTAPGNTAQA